MSEDAIIFLLDQYVTDDSTVSYEEIYDCFDWEYTESVDDWIEYTDQFNEIRVPLRLVVESREKISIRYERSPREFRS